jgi:hypothetical protein
VSGAVDRAVEFVSADIDLVAQGIDLVKENIEELRSIAREYGARRGTLRSFVDRITLHDEHALRHDRVNLLTVHAAKGLEFAAVFLVVWKRAAAALTGSRTGVRDRGGTTAVLCRLTRPAGISTSHMPILASWLDRQRWDGSVALWVRLEVLTLICDSQSEQQRNQPAGGVAGERVKHPRWDLGTVLAVEGKDGIPW